MGASHRADDQNSFFSDLEVKSVCLFVYLFVDLSISQDCCMTSGGGSGGGRLLRRRRVGRGPGSGRKLKFMGGPQEYSHVPWIFPQVLNGEAG